MSRIRWGGVWRRLLYASTWGAVIAGVVLLGWRFALGSLLSFALAVFTREASDMRAEGDDPWQVRRSLTEQERRDAHNTRGGFP